MGNGNSTSSKSNAHGHTAKVGHSNEPQYVPSRQGKTSTKAEMFGSPYGTKGGSLFRDDEYIDKPKVGTSEQHGNIASLDSDDTFNDYIRRAKQKMRTGSNVGREHGNHPAIAAAAAAPPDQYSAATDTANNNKEHQSDQFSEFIQLAKKKLRTTSGVGRNGSFQRG